MSGNQPIGQLVTDDEKLKVWAMELVERIARVLAGFRLSANADGAECSAAESVDALWPAHREEAVAIMKTLREPSPTMIEAGMHGEWGVMMGREIDALEQDGFHAAHSQAS